MQGVLSPESQHQGFPMWLTGSLLALVIHGLLIVYWLWAAAPVAADDSPPAAIMIEVADSPEAMQTVQNNITSEKVDAEASQAQNREQAHSDGVAAPAEQQQPQPLKEPQKPLPLVEKALISQAAARAAKSQKDEKRRAQQERQRLQKQQQEQQREQLASAQAVQAQVQAQQAQRNAARQTVASNSVSPQQRATWAGKVMAHIEKHKRHLDTAGVRNMATVSIALDGEGNVLNVALKQSSGSAALDREALAVIRRSSPVPAPPDGQAIRFTVQVDFSPTSARR